MFLDVDSADAMKQMCLEKFQQKILSAFVRR